MELKQGFWKVDLNNATFSIEYFGWKIPGWNFKGVWPHEFIMNLYEILVFSRAPLFLFVDDIVGTEKNLVEINFKIELKWQIIEIKSFKLSRAENYWNTFNSRNIAFKFITDCSSRSTL